MWDDPNKHIPISPVHIAQYSCPPDRNRAWNILKII
jgi:hypothetical protein